MVKIKNHAITVIIWSEDYKKLAQWYQDVLHVPFKTSSDRSDDAFVAFDFGQNWFCIGQHSEVSGENKDPYRIMVEFYVEDIEGFHKELQEKGVNIIAAPFQDPVFPEGWCMTIADPEGNIIQLYENKK